SLPHPVVVDRVARMTHSRETDRVQLVVLGDLILDSLLQRPWLIGRKRDERFRRVHKLAVELAVGISRDAAAGWLRRRFTDLPLRERRRIEHVFVSAADD